jgi:sarcosine oxidase subunit gamma
MVAAARPFAGVPALAPRRSFVHRVLQQAGARFERIGDGLIAMEYDRPDDEVVQARQMGIADLSVLPRTGFKGTGTVEWLTAQGLKIGAESNVAYRQDGCEWAARLAPTEIFLLDDLAGGGRLMAQLNGAWSWGSEKPRRLIGYPMPRSESHAWFAVTGAKAPAMFAKICGVDLRPHRFANGRIAQTSLAKMSAILIRVDLGRTAAYYVLADSASAEYLWGCLIDAMAEFTGVPVGLLALRTLAGEG